VREADVQDYRSGGGVFVLHRGLREEAREVGMTGIYFWSMDRSMIEYVEALLRYGVGY
jgi:hypothetical protein